MPSLHAYVHYVCMIVSVCVCVSLARSPSLSPSCLLACLLAGGLHSPSLSRLLLLPLADQAACAEVVSPSPSWELPSIILCLRFPL